jgi:DNA repair protein RecN (Recombination protein N)
MLQHLKISNLALLKEVTLEFGEGFTAVTGETGAGKSVLLGALNLLSGGRGDKSLVRTGAEACEVEAMLWLPGAKAVDRALDAMGLPACEEGVLVLSRSLGLGRAGKVRINGQLATVRNLQELGEAWIDFHGPGEPQKLLHERHQLALLDSFAKNQQERKAYEALFLEWVATRKEIAELRQAAQLSPDEQAFLQSQIDAIDGLKLSEEAIEALERDFRLLTNGEELRTKALALSEVLSGFEGVVERLGMGLQLARELSALEPSHLPLADRMESLLLEAEDLGQEVNGLGEDGGFDEETADCLREQMEQWMSLRRKYGGTVEGVLAGRREMWDRLERQGDLAGTVARLEAKQETLEGQLSKAGEALRATRAKAALALSREALGLLQKLGFAKGRFHIEIIREETFCAHGTSRCEYRFAPNPGTDPYPLGKIASSGEIARVMLALKAVLARVDATPILVFDEVDANVGGEAAGVVGRELAGLAKEGHQVFCITHLPQVAATAGSHFVVRKEQGENYTEVTISDLGEAREGRLDELSRMLGDRSSKSARQHAEELLGVLVK